MLKIVYVSLSGLFSSHESGLKQRCLPSIRFLSLGTGDDTKTDEFSEKVQRGGGGVIFNPKIYVADFGPLNRALKREKITL